MAVLADCANVAMGGKLNVMGVFDNIHSKTFPAVHPYMVLVLRLRFDYNDGDRQDQELLVTLRDEDNKEYGAAKTVVGIPKIAPGEFGHANQILTFSGLALAKPGMYHFQIKWNGQPRHQVPLSVRLLPEGHELPGG